MKEYWYCTNGTNAEGPHSEEKIAELLRSGVLLPSTLVCAVGSETWVPLSSIVLPTSEPVAEKVAKPTPKKNAFWYNIYDLDSAKEAAKAGFWAAVFCASVTAIFATISLFMKQAFFSIDAYAYVDALIFAFLAWRIRKMSRVFSVIALVLFILEKIEMARTLGATGLPMAIIMILFFIHGVRGTFAYHKYNKIG